jgi:hypothetical protein
MEFVKAEDIIKAFSIKDNNGLISKLLGEYVPLDMLVQINEKLGFDEDLPESKKHLNYNLLKLQSKRIFNRINKYLSDNKISPESLFESSIVLQTVKTKTKTEKIEIIKDVDFFKKLHSIGIIKKDKTKKNICKFLCIDE